MKLEIEITLSKEQEDLLVHISQFNQDEDYTDDHEILDEKGLIQVDNGEDINITSLGLMYLNQLYKTNVDRKKT